MWFESLMGFKEISPDQVRENISLNGEELRSLVNGKTYCCGSLETPSLGELRNRISQSKKTSGKICLREEIADVKELHIDPVNAGALFQVASQFNLLEMISPTVTPEAGVDRYEYDRTQGPMCAIAAGAGIIYRNYFVEANGQIGQTANNQIDCLADIGTYLGNRGNQLWEMKNGYALASEDGLIKIKGLLNSADETEIDEIKKLLRIGVQWDTSVTIGNTNHKVSQAYCSALPVTYTDLPSEMWVDFASLVLEASYEATICAAILNSQKTRNNKVYLTLVGGGVFGNEIKWIINAIRKALDLYSSYDLEVIIVSYGSSNPHVQNLMQEMSQ